VTDTPTATATFTIDQICEAFHVSLLTPETVFAPSQSLPFFFTSDYPGLDLVLTITNLENGEEKTIMFPGSQPILGQLSLDFAAGPGDYELTVSANSTDHAGICERHSRFTIIPEPEITAEVTADIPVQSATQTPIIIIVSATPDTGTAAPIPTANPESTPEAIP
jgi:hypothetical protein